MAYACTYDEMEEILNNKALKKDGRPVKATPDMIMCALLPDDSAHISAASWFKKFRGQIIYSLFRCPTPTHIFFLQVDRDCEHSAVDELCFCSLTRDEVYFKYRTAIEERRRPGDKDKPLTEEEFYRLWRGCFPYVLLTTGDEV